MSEALSARPSRRLALLAVVPIALSACSSEARPDNNPPSLEQIQPCDEDAVAPLTQQQADLEVQLITLDSGSRMVTITNTGELIERVYNDAGSVGGNNQQIINPDNSRTFVIRVNNGRESTFYSIENAGKTYCISTSMKIFPTEDGSKNTTTTSIGANNVYRQSFPVDEGEFADFGTVASAITVSSYIFTLLQLRNSPQ